jgi:glucose-6-phosphate 1-dehydrogenase
MAEENSRNRSIYGGTADPCAIVVFGASGDLAKRKVLPAMYDLAQHKSLGERRSCQDDVE